MIAARQVQARHKTEDTLDQSRQRFARARLRPQTETSGQKRQAPLNLRRHREWQRQYGMRLERCCQMTRGRQRPQAQSPPASKETGLSGIVERTRGKLNHVGRQRADSRIALTVAKERRPNCIGLDAPTSVDNHSHPNRVSRGISWSGNSLGRELSDIADSRV